jgi:hypothetical protein
MSKKIFLKIDRHRHYKKLNKKNYTIKETPKKEIYNILNGRKVKCFTAGHEEIKLFGVQDIENGEIYILDLIEE